MSLTPQLDAEVTATRDQADALLEILEHGDLSRNPFVSFQSQVLLILAEIGDEIGNLRFREFEQRKRIDTALAKLEQDPE